MSTERAAAVTTDMSPEACDALLRDGRWGMLAMIGEDGPYAIPMAYGWDGATVYVGVSEGLKTRLLDRDPRCALTVSLAEGAEQWRSVIVAGRAHWASTPEERMRAGQALRRQHGAADPPPPPAPAAPTGDAGVEPAAQAPVSRRFSGGRLLIIADATITGRAKG